MFKYDIENSTYYLYHILSNGQIIYIGFDFIELNRKTETEIFNVVLAIGNKKKNINSWLNYEKNSLTMQSTGRCGLEGLMWAREQLIKFEEFIFYNSRYNIKLIVSADDSKRFHVYEKALMKLGYKKERMYNKRHMVKTIKGCDY